MHRPLIVAHRGASSLALENTLSSYEKAIEIGADMIEFDVRMTRDGVMIAYHDPAISGRPIHTLTYQEVNDLLQARGIIVPTVEEVLKLTQKRIRLDVELKETGYERELVTLILKYFGTENFVMTSFADQAIETIKQKFPQIRIGLLLGEGQPEQPLCFALPDLFPLHRLRRVGADYVIAHYRLLKFGFIDRMVKEKILIYAWTVDDPHLLKKLLHDPRIAAVITNTPDKAIELLR